MNKNIKICFMGTPHFGVNVLKRLIEEYTVSLVVTKRDSFTKKGKVIESDVKVFSRENNLNYIQPEDVNSKEVVDLIKSLDIDFIVTASFGVFLKLDILHSSKLGVINVHGSMLPKYRGAAPIQRAIENGDEYLGVSIMKTILKMDAGYIYSQDKIKLEESDNTETMMDKLSILGANLIVPVIDKLYNNEPIEVIHQEKDKVTFSHMIEPSESIIDFRDSATNIFNKIRAFYPDPSAYFIKDNVIYKIFDSRVVKDNSGALPGTVIDNNKALIIKCGKDSLSIKDIQPASKSRMDIKSFLNGRRDLFKVGSIIK